MPPEGSEIVHRKESSFQLVSPFATEGKTDEGRKFNPIHHRRRNCKSIFATFRAWRSQKMWNRSHLVPSRCHLLNVFTGFNDGAIPYKPRFHTPSSRWSGPPSLHRVYMHVQKCVWNIWLCLAPLSAQDYPMAVVLNSSPRPPHLKTCPRHVCSILERLQWTLKLYQP